ncbi:hypothetical protein CMUS01_11440 [Colletotrichum musicola]|uniref:Uncharacterized protein n=1 Tax=Colletotrichum musicola TaxID=2175873 RepID=A0A8H6JYQ9_9PEZI|nr:hypothetical protein CMUS01_11440 [Colletotrichum musicola]
MESDRKPCRNPDRDRGAYERKKRRENIQENLRLPGFALPPIIFGINYKHWWRPLAAIPSDFGLSRDTNPTGPHHVADRLGDLYEIAIAELGRSGLDGHTTGTVDRARLLNQTFYDNVLQRLKYINPDWGSLREDVGKRSLSYGMAIYDDGRRKFLTNPTRIPELGDNTPTYTRLWRLVDRWLELTSEGNDVLSLDNGISASSAGLGATNLPPATARLAGYLKHRENAEGDRSTVDLDMASLYEMLVSDVEGRLARENLQLAKRVKQLEGERQTMRTELDNLRRTQIAYRDRRRSTWRRILNHLDYTRLRGKAVSEFLAFVEKKEETVLQEEKKSGLGRREPTLSIIQK